MAAKILLHALPHEVDTILRGNGNAADRKLLPTSA